MVFSVKITYYLIHTENLSLAKGAKGQGPNLMTEYTFLLSICKRHLPTLN